MTSDMTADEKSAITGAEIDALSVSDALKAQLRANREIIAIDPNQKSDLNWVLSHTGKAIAEQIKQHQIRPAQLGRKAVELKNPLYRKPAPEPLPEGRLTAIQKQQLRASLSVGSDPSEPYRAPLAENERSIAGKIGGGLRNVWKNSVKPKLPGLKSAFASAASGAVGGIVAKMAVTAAGTALLGPAFAAVAGFGWTAFGFYKDYKKQKETDEAVDRAWDYFKKHKVKYGTKLVMNGVSALGGFHAAQVVLDHLAQGADLSDALDAVHSIDPQAAAAVKQHIVAAAPDVDLPDTDVVAQGGPDVNVAGMAPYHPLESLELSPVPVDHIAAGEPDTLVPYRPDYQMDGDVIAQGTVPDIEIPQGALEKLELLSHQEGLSPKAHKIIDAALKGQKWALRDAGLGLMNGKYGFGDLHELSGHVDAKSWGAKLLEKAADAGDAKAKLDFAYLQYSGVNDAVAINKQAALETVKKLDHVWAGGEKLLSDMHLKEAKDSFLAHMPEGTNINDYNIEPGNGGYNFVPKPESLHLDAQQATALRNAGFDPDTCKITGRDLGGLKLENCQPLPKLAAGF